MKNLANIIGIAIMLCVSFSFASCDKGEYGDGETWVKPTPTKNDTIIVRDTVTVHATDTVTTDPSTPTPDPSTSIDWSAQMEKSFGFVKQTGLWPSTIRIHMTDGRTEDFGCYLPMETHIEAPTEIMAASEAPASRYVGMEPAVKDSTAWELNPSDGYYYRTVSRSQVIHMTNYDATIISSHKEAYMVKEGRIIYFLHGQEDQPSRYDDTPTTGEDETRNGKTYSVENAIITMQHHLHGLVTLYPSAKTRVLREKVEEQEEEEVTPTPPTADYEIPGLQRFMSASRVWNEDEKHYADVYTFEANDSYFFVVVNFTYNKKDDKEKQTGVVTKSIAKSGVYYNAKYASETQGCAVYDHGTYIPGIYSFDDTGFTVVGGRSNGEKVSQTVFDTDAVNRGIKNMKKENNAKPTPIIYQRSCTVGNNGVWTIIGKTSGHTVTFTVKSK